MADQAVYKMADAWRRYCEGRPGCKRGAVAELHAKRPRLFHTMVQAVAADMDLADHEKAVESQEAAVDEAELALDLAIARAREIYVDDYDTATDPRVFVAAERLLKETDALEGVRRERDIAQVSRLLWMREAKLALREAKLAK